MVEKNFVVKNETGLHARPASLFVQKAAKFKSTIKIKKDGKEGNAKSNGSEITISCTGEDEQEALNALIDLLDNLEE